MALLPHVFNLILSLLSEKLSLTGEFSNSISIATLSILDLFIDGPLCGERHLNTNLLAACQVVGQISQRLHQK